MLPIYIGNRRTSSHHLNKPHPHLSELEQPSSYQKMIGEFASGMLGSLAFSTPTASQRLVRNWSVHLPPFCFQYSQQHPYLLILPLALHLPTSLHQRRPEKAKESIPYQLYVTFYRQERTGLKSRSRRLSVPWTVFSSVPSAFGILTWHQSPPFLQRKWQTLSFHWYSTRKRQAMSSAQGEDTHWWSRRRSLLSHRAMWRSKVLLSGGM